MVFATLNFALAGLCLFWVLFWCLVMVVAAHDPALQGERRASTMLGGVILSLPGAFGLVVYLTAGIGLVRRAAWGYYAHLGAAWLAALTCVGAIYTAVAVPYALRAEFYEEFFPVPGRGSGLNGGRSSVEGGVNDIPPEAWLDHEDEPRWRRPSSDRYRS